MNFKERNIDLKCYFFLHEIKTHETEGIKHDSNYNVHLKYQLKDNFQYPITSHRNHVRIPLHGCYVPMLQKVMDGAIVIALIKLIF